MDITIRKYKCTDYSELAELLGIEYNSRIDQNTLEKKYISEERSILVAVTNTNQVVGCSFLEIQEDFIRPSRIMYVTYVAVNQQFRKNGIGRKLFNAIELECNTNNCSAIELTSANYRTEAHAFYIALGFTKKKTTLFIKEL